MRRKRRRERAFDEVPRWQIYLPLGLYLLFTLVPFYWMLLFSLRPAGSTSLVPWPMTFDHFEKVWNDRSFSVFFQNSALIGVFTLICTTTVALAAWLRARALQLPYQAELHAGAAVLAVHPRRADAGAALPDLQEPLADQLPLSVVIAETVFQLPLSIILISGFIKNVPYSLEEAAWVDGCSRLQAFRIVVLPMLRPGLIAVGSFAFVHSWNHFLFALMFLMDQDKQTIPVGLSTLIGADSVDFGALAAGGVISAVPVVIVFAFIQKWLITGFSAGAVKG